MKIGFFEYVRGGGFIDHPIASIPSSLLREGRAMLEALLLNREAAGSFVPVVPLDGRIEDGCRVIHTPIWSFQEQIGLQPGSHWGASAITFW